MKLFRLTHALAVFAGCFGICLATEENKEEITLSPISHEYYWKEFTVTTDAPFSDNRYYRLKKVRKNGDVELIDCAVAEIAT